MDQNRPIYQTVKVSVRQGGGCCQWILWAIAIVFFISLCGVLAQLAS